jgi:hypothetical protein
LILIFIYLITGYFKEQRTQADLMRQIESSRVTLQQLPAPPADLSERLKEITLINENLKQSVVAENIDSTEIINSLLETADACNMKVNPLVTDGEMKKGVDASTYLVLPIKLEIEGKLTDYIKFISRLEDTAVFPNLAIEDSTITRINARLETDVITSATSEITASLKVSIVSRLVAGK